ncbi:oligo-1,6-glucosidase [Clostridium saccharoperbutylacetonicum]|uniref:Oligo-1,6-glucosidase MalL n=1 Tax=Clostridium saccharoperbutylacetonicum N1-4(HMT) TaxID=931276 RepID=M1MC65_9CLOT|nr:alpha-glucosidase [Clostridium saccharoperbutylacetonicum]AGF55519.1 oligo-1,6-glucosidase MalL [Clostridium saccharoperbutylacetonicum N1-4(HMT)]NRT63762.1 oligo-1,6-glucosidase [Clostridium saccharoperbutylacetonicum]NSB27125.1 oligo-1,6-glucosidase [Clostridium saccharoperbutylacetonicum]NSB40611.1 oligo-1,6-glucosidase [Clostridium saccharoperbutylacetonicum]
MNKKWWKESVVYQIYPRSFKDSNGDGIGDLKGIIEKLDYLKELGIDVIWLSPIYKSPNDDNGYDISDYRDIMDEFGSLEDFDVLLDEAHKRNIKIIMDLVVNHTSDEHRWFIESKKSVDNKFRDYYVWKNGKDGQPPNNWGSFFSGSTWEYDEETEMYYLHLFSKKQPDLNWENNEVRNSVYDMMKWWLDKGIDGFRMDVINMISKVQTFPDGPKEENASYGDIVPYAINGPRVHEFLKEMHKEVLSKYDIMTVGETPAVSPEDVLKYAGENEEELNMVFHFEHMDLGFGPEGKWSNLGFKLTELKGILTKWQKALENDGWNSLYWDNHDQPRAVSRFGNDKEYWLESAKMLGTCLHMMKGTPYIFQGEEIGMTNVAFDNIEDYRDIETLNSYEELVEKKGKNKEEMMQAIHDRSRDNARTPMQWDDSENAGFTLGEPWIKVNPNYININAKAQIDDKDSIFNYYKKLISIRKEYPIVVYGRYDLILEESEKIYAYTRTLDNEKLLVICNFTEKETLFQTPSDINTNSQKLIISNYDVFNHDLTNIVLRPYETRVYLLQI